MGGGSLIRMVDKKKVNARDTVNEYLDVFMLDVNCFFKIHNTCLCVKNIVSCIYVNFSYVCYIRI